MKPLDFVSYCQPINKLEAAYKNLDCYLDDKTLARPWDEMSQADYEKGHLDYIFMAMRDVREAGGLSDPQAYDLLRRIEDATDGTTFTCLSQTALASITRVLCKTVATPCESLEDLTSRIRAGMDGQKQDKSLHFQV